MDKTELQKQTKKAEWWKNIAFVRNKEIKKRDKYIKRLQIRVRELSKQSNIVYCKDCKKRNTTLCVMDNGFESRDMDYCSKGIRKDR